LLVMCCYVADFQRAGFDFGGEAKKNVFIKRSPTKTDLRDLIILYSRFHAEPSNENEQYDGAPK
jgi:hypothetical protein